MNKISYCFLYLYSLLPLWLHYLISDIAYFYTYYVFRYRRKIVRKNLVNSFPKKNLKEIVSIEKKFYRHLCDLFVETYKLMTISEKQIRKRCVFKNTELLNKHFAEDRGVIAILGHYGNWEWMTSYGLHLTNNADFFPLYKPLRNKSVDANMLKIRSRFGATPIPKNNILRQMIKNKQQRKPYVAAFLGDQTPNQFNLNFWVQFLNQATPVLEGTEKLARKFNCAVVSIQVTKPKRGYYVIEYIDITSNPNEFCEGELTRLHTAMLEKYIQKTPEFWLWSHKRWKHKPTQEQTEMINKYYA